MEKSSKQVRASSTLRFVIKTFATQNLFKVIIECLLASLKNILILVNAVWLLNRLADMIFQQAGFANMIRVVVSLMIVNSLSAFAQYYYQYHIKPQSDLRVKSQLELLLMQHGEELPLNCYDNSNFYTAVKHAQNAISEIMFSAYNDFVQMVGNIAALISAIVTVILMNPMLLFFVAFTIPMIFINQKYGLLLSKRNLQLALGDRKKQYAREVWLKKDIAKIFKFTNAWKIADKHYEDGYHNNTQIYSTYGTKLFIWDLLSRGFSITLIMLVCYGYGIFAYRYSGEFSIAEFPVMFVAVMNMISRIRKIYRAHENLCGYGGQIDELKSFLEMPAEKTNENGVNPSRFESLEFRHVWFSYDKTNWVLKDVSFRIEAGERVAILGYNGAGKSTLIKLILGFYSVDRGEILYNGININCYSLQDYRKQFAVAFQDYKLFSCSLLDNLLMHQSVAGEETIVKDVLAQKNKTEFSANIHHILGREYDNDGLVLSGGQRQWLALARLYFMPFEIALLDEPSAAFDPITSSEMQREMIQLVGDRTMLLVSHDMSVTKLVQRILFFENKTLAACGNHETLVRTNARYADFYMAQAENFNKRKADVV